MAEQLDAVAREPEQHRQVLLDARRYLVGLIYEPTPEEEKINLGAKLEALIEKYPWLVKPEERFMGRGDYRTITPLSLLREQLEQEYGQN